MAGNSLALEWLVKLEGHHEDLSRLSEILSTSTVQIIVEGNGDYYLKSADFGALQDPIDVLAAAKSLVEIVNAYAMIDFGDFEAVRVGGSVIRLDADGTRHCLGFRDLTLRFLPSEMRVNFEVEAWISLARQKRDVADALHFYVERNWFNLWKTYEIIRDSMGGEHKLLEQGWTTKKELSRFTQTVQSRAVLGDEARHASVKYQPPPKPTSLPEAKALVEALLLCWLRSQ